MISAPQIVQTKAEPAAVIHLIIPRSEMMKAFGPAVGELMAELAKQAMLLEDAERRQSPPEVEVSSIVSVPGF